VIILITRSRNGIGRTATIFFKKRCIIVILQIGNENIFNMISGLFIKHINLNGTDTIYLLFFDKDIRYLSHIFFDQFCRLCHTMMYPNAYKFEGKKVHFKHSLVPMHTVKYVLFNYN
jgi:hypothetical protein